MRCSLFKFTPPLNTALLFYKVPLVKRRHLHAYLTDAFKNKVSFPLIVNLAGFR
jgi:hypothetical protein